MLCVGTCPLAHALGLLNVLWQWQDFVCIPDMKVGRHQYNERAIHRFRFNRDCFLEHYHKRSNVETVFSMIKAKFGASVRAKTPIAQVNEVLCKVLCHNICVLIQSIYELGLEPTFWTFDTKEAVVPKVLEKWDF